MTEIPTTGASRPIGDPLPGEWYDVARRACLMIDRTGEANYIYGSDMQKAAGIASSVWRKFCNAYMPPSLFRKRCAIPGYNVGRSNRPATFRCGRRLCPFCHARRVADAYSAVMRAAAYAASRGVFNLGSMELHSDRFTARFADWGFVGAYSAVLPVYNKEQRAVGWVKKVVFITNDKPKMRRSGNWRLISEDPGRTTISETVIRTFIYPTSLFDDPDMFCRCETAAMPGKFNGRNRLWAAYGAARCDNLKSSKSRNKSQKSSHAADCAADEEKRALLLEIAKLKEELASYKNSTESE